MLFAAREPTDELAGLPELVVEGLDDADARTLLASVIPGRLDERVADQLVAEARGNPLALLELPRGLSPAQLAGGFGLPGALSLEGRIEQSFLQRLEALPETPGGCCWSPRRSRPAIRRCCGARPSDWDLRRRRSSRPSRPA